MLNSKILKIGLFLIISCALLALSGCAALTGVDKNKLRADMKAYLEKEYHQEAVVEQPELIGNTGTGYEKFSAEAHLVKDPEVKFWVSFHRADKSFTDGYLPSRIILQANKAVKKEMAKYYGAENIISCHTTLQFPYNAKVNEAMTYESLLKDYKGRVEIHISGFISMESFDEETEAKRIEKFFRDYLIKKNFSDIQFYNTYVKSSYRSIYDVMDSGKPYTLPKQPFAQGYVFSDFIYDTKSYGQPEDKELLKQIKKQFVYKDY